jgi:lipopolysaccharide/colanic/teichoic acid biosynthesis glycosyltransferase
VAMRLNASMAGPAGRSAASSAAGPIGRPGAGDSVAGDLAPLRRAHHPLTLAERVLKRAFDVSGALCLLVLTAPMMLLAALLIRLTSRGPALFSQIRVGAHGREFAIFKLRTMVADAEAHTGPVMAAARDPRITKIGRILRATRLDELPQLCNVLRGEMSLIGPRPERPFFVRIFCQHLRGYGLRFAVKPGITGLAQTECRYSTAPALKLRCDLRYIDNYSLLLDAQIVLRTILTVLKPSCAEGFAASPRARAMEDSE